MCKLCNGTYVVHEQTGYGARISGCPECGPEPEEARNARLAKFLNRLPKEGKS